MEHQRREQDPESQQDNRKKQGPNDLNRDKPDASSEYEENSNEENPGNPAFDEEETEAEEMEDEE